MTDRQTDRMTGFGGGIAVGLVMSTTHRSVLAHDDDGLTSAVSLLQEVAILLWPEVSRRISVTE